MPINPRLQLPVSSKEARPSPPKTGFQKSHKSSGVMTNTLPTTQRNPFKTSMRFNGRTYSVDGKDEGLNPSYSIGDTVSIG